MDGWRKEEEKKEEPTLRLHRELALISIMVQEYPWLPLTPNHDSPVCILMRATDCPGHKRGVKLLCSYTALCVSSEHGLLSYAQLERVRRVPSLSEQRQTMFSSILLSL